MTTRRLGLLQKRLSSPKKLSLRVDEAVKQIKRTGKKGFVAINVDLLLYGNDVTEAERAVESRLAVIGD